VTYTDEQLDAIQEDDEKNCISKKLIKELERFNEKYGG